MTNPVERHHDDSGAAHATVSSYLIGFVLSVILTAVPFGMVMAHAAPVAILIPVIFGLGVIQIVVHLVCFLHMKRGSSHLWNNAAFVFAVIVVGILIAGSLWIMYHLTGNMMPGAMPVD